MGWANALAAGVMLGAGYALIEAGLDRGALRAALGALAGILWVRFTHALSRTGDVELNRVGDATASYRRRVIGSHAFHSAVEGVAIGAGMAVGTPFGVFLAATIALHNVPEAAVLSAVLRHRRMSTGRVALTAAATNLGQVALGLGAYAVTLAGPAVAGPILGFAAGAFLYLVLAELLPDSYHQAGHTSIALVVVVAMGIVVLTADWLT
jgi:ZIP family zinc transporter